MPVGRCDWCDRELKDGVIPSTLYPGCCTNCESTCMKNDLEYYQIDIHLATLFEERGIKGSLLEEAILICKDPAFALFVKLYLRFKSILAELVRYRNGTMSTFTCQDHIKEDNERSVKYNLMLLEQLGRFLKAPVKEEPKKYYFIAYTQVSLGSQCSSVSTWYHDVISMHPFEWQRKHDNKTYKKYTLISWKEITEGEARRLLRQ